MRKLFAAAAAAAVMVIWANAARAADPVEGVWQSEPGENGEYEHVEFKKCGEAICGTLVASFDSAGASLVTGEAGKKIIWNMKPSGNGRYKGGRMLLPGNDPKKGPSDGKSLSSKMQHSGDSLSIAACFIGGLICADQTWTRVK